MPITVKKTFIYFPSMCAFESNALICVVCLEITPHSLQNPVKVKSKIVRGTNKEFKWKKLLSKLMILFSFFYSCSIYGVYQTKVVGLYLLCCVGYSVLVCLLAWLTGWLFVWLVGWLNGSLVLLLTLLYAWCIPFMMVFNTKCHQSCIYAVFCVYRMKW